MRKYLTVVVDVTDWSHGDVSRLLTKEDVVSKGWGDVIARERELRARVRRLEEIAPAERMQADLKAAVSKAWP